MTVKRCGEGELTVAMLICEGDEILMFARECKTHIEAHFVEQVLRDHVEMRMPVGIAALCIAFAFAAGLVIGG